MSIADSRLADFEPWATPAAFPWPTESDVLRYRQSFDEVEAREGRAKCQNGLFDPHFEIPFVLELATQPDGSRLRRSPDRSRHSVDGQPLFLQIRPFRSVRRLASGRHLLGLGAGGGSLGLVCRRRQRRGQRLHAGHSRQPPAGNSRHTANRQRPTTNLLSINQEVPVSRGRSCAAPSNMELKAGEISLHDGLTIHGSPPNRSTRRRCGLAMIYLPTHVRQAGENSLRHALEDRAGPRRESARAISTAVSLDSPSGFQIEKVRHRHLKEPIGPMLLRKTKSSSSPAPAAGWAKASPASATAKGPAWWSPTFDGPRHGRRRLARTIGPGHACDVREDAQLRELVDRDRQAVRPRRWAGEQRRHQLREAGAGNDAPTIGRTCWRSICGRHFCFRSWFAVRCSSKSPRAAAS